MTRFSFKSLAIVAILLGVAAAPLIAAPPRPGEIEKYKQDGSYEQRLEFQKSLGNDQYHPALVERAKANIRRAALEADGVPPATIARMVPAPPGSPGMPSLGTNKIPAILIEFSDLQHSAVNSQAYIDDVLFDDGVAANYPFDSLKSYYERSSFGKLTIEGNTLGWYRTAYPRANVPETAAGREGLIGEAIRAYDAAGHDFAQYDNNNDGEIDYLLVVYAGPNNGWGNFWWAYQTGWFATPDFRVDGKSIGTYVFQYTNQQDDTAPFGIRTAVHETGHALGLPDLYDYDTTVGPQGGCAGLDIMDSSQCDHNGFHKWLLEWSTPTVIGVGAKQLTFRPAATSGDGAVVMKGASAENPFDEFFFVENRTGGGNDGGPAWVGSGLMIWHVDSTLNAAGNGFAFNNSYTPHKLLRVMEADGLEEIEAGGWGDSGDFWKQGQDFDENSAPASVGYDGLPTAVSVRKIQPVTGGISAFVSVDDIPPNLRVATIDKSGRKLTLIFDETVVPVSNPTLAFSAGLIQATYSKGADTNALEYSLSRRAFTSETATLSLAEGSVVDPTGNVLAEIRKVPVVIGVRPDATDPAVESATINANGDKLTLIFDENVDYRRPPVLALSGGPITAKFKSGDGTRAFRFDLSRVVTAKEKGVYDFESGSAINAVGFPNVAVRRRPLTNESDVKRDVDGGSSSQKRSQGKFANYYVDLAYQTSSNFYNDDGGYTGDAYYAYVYSYFALYYRYSAGDTIRWGGKTKKTRGKALANYLELRNYQAQMSAYALAYSQQDYARTGSGTSLYAYYYSYYANAYAQQDMARK
ncbi:MAG TPA: M6 family metalloprotease domain-containing protein [Pirellulaceae bacterium]|jgi:M6 family metalloprotease-like protein|nr:M6 family metalloprotease domain-containing protein [Pirellulaceae bacterium]